MTEGSGLYLAGPALVKSAIGQDVGHEELGGAKMHAAISGTIDFREPDDDACLARVRALAADRCRAIRKPPQFLASAAVAPGRAAGGHLPDRLARAAGLLRSPRLAGLPGRRRQLSGIQGRVSGGRSICGYGPAWAGLRSASSPISTTREDAARGAAIRRRDLSRQRGQDGPLHHGLQPDLDCRWFSCRTSTASWWAAIREQAGIIPPAPSWST